VFSKLTFCGGAIYLYIDNRLNAGKHLQRCKPSPIQQHQKLFIISKV